MNPLTTSAFDLPDHLAAKADPTLIAGDEQHFAAIAESLEQSIADLSDRLDAERRAPGGTGQEAMDRDLEVHRLTARLRALRRFGLDLCLGHVVRADDPEPVYIGRLGLTDSAGDRLLLDWRSPAAEQQPVRRIEAGEIDRLDVGLVGRPFTGRAADPDAGEPVMRREHQHVASVADVELDAVGRDALPVGVEAARQ